MKIGDIFIFSNVAHHKVEVVLTNVPKPPKTGEWKIEISKDLENRMSPFFVGVSQLTPKS